MTDSNVVTRFAPSPTGNLHIGGARTALFAWAFARQQKGQFILRIEDTDRARSTPESTRGILRDLQWLGLDWDQGPTLTSIDPYERETQLGPHAPYFQSQRHEDGIYNQQIQKLLDAGLAYEDGDAIRFRMDKDVAFDDAVYGHIEVKADDLEDFIIRKGEQGGFLPTFHLAVVVDDALMGVTHVIRGQEHLSNTAKHAALYDALGFPRPQWVHLPSIMNADGSKMSKRDKAKAARKAAKDIKINIDHCAEYICKVIVHGFFKPPETKLDKLINLPGTIALSEKDTANIKIKVWGGSVARPKGNSLIEEVKEAIHRFLDKEIDSIFIAEAIADYLDINLPEIDVADFRRSGYLPQVLLNYIALLGWNPGDDIERFDTKFLIERFDFKRIGKKNAQFDRVKLARFNTETLAAMDPEVFRKKLRDHFAEYHPAFLEKLDEQGFATFAKMYQARSQTLDTPAELGRFFFVDPDDYDPKAVRKNLLKNDNEGLNVLREFRGVLERCDDWTADTLHKLIETYVAEEQLKNMGSVAQPLRVALTGSAVSPEIGPTLELLGKDTVLRRIDRCVKHAPAMRFSDA
ncbi:MAG: hypothetical protein Kow00105_11900 [Phycisphaeraceae bacterium]